jgi:hypothetical protein
MPPTWNPLNLLWGLIILVVVIVFLVILLRTIGVTV